MSHQSLRIFLIISLLSIIAAKEILGPNNTYNVPCNGKINITVENTTLYVYTKAESEGGLAHEFKIYNNTNLTIDNFKCGAVDDIDNYDLNDNETLKEPEGFLNENDVYTVTVSVKKDQYMVTQVNLTNMELNETILVSSIMVSSSIIKLIVIIILLIGFIFLISICWVCKKCIC